jgi:hypothetical protein
MGAVRALFILNFFAGLASISVHASPLNKRAKICRALITYHFKDGTKKNKTLKLKAQSREECQKKAHVHKVNFAPQTVAKKKVKVFYE